MKRAGLVLTALAWVAAPVAAAAVPAPLVLERTILLPGVEGRIDHFRAGPRVVVCALGNHSVEIVDPVAGTVTGRIKDLPEPQGVWDLPAFNRLAVASTDDGTVRWFDGRTLAPISSVTLGEDADNVRYDEAAKRLWVGFGEGDHSGLACFDPATGATEYEIPVAAHPESFQLEEGGTRIFVNVPDAHAVQVADRASRAVVATWKLDEDANFPMALDDVRHRVLLCARHPARLIVLAMETGKRIATLPCAGDADDLWWDAARNRAYLSGGAGAISVIALHGDHDYRVIANLPTGPGARTSAFDPATGSLFLAVPHRGAQPASLRVYRATP